MGVDIVMREDLLLVMPQKPFHYQPIADHWIANVRLFPGFSFELLRVLLQQPLEGLVLETYGAGNAPNYDPAFLAMLSEASLRGVLIVNCSQCQHGTVDMGHYVTGSALKTAGLLSGQDMTTEAVHCKLLYLLSKYTDKKQIQVNIEKSLVGELGHHSMH